MATIDEQNEIAIKAMQFKNMVNTILEDEGERSKLFDILRNYLESKKVKRLVRDLKLILDNSKKYPLFKEIRSFIEADHVFVFDRLTEGARTGERIVHLKRHGNEPLGFKFKGGLEHNIGIYVTSIVPGSAAHASGLRIGDEILKVNGFVLHESIHDEVVNVLKSKKSLTFVTKHMGKIPSKVNNRIVWQEVDPNLRIATNDVWDPKFASFVPGSPQIVAPKGNDDRLVALKIGKDGLGCSILSGIENFEGVFISVVTPNQLADQVGLKVGDQILQVNGRIFDKIKHSEAVDVLKSRRDLTMIVRHNEKVAEYLLKKSKALKPILVPEGEQRVVSKQATFGEDPVIEYIEPVVLTEEDEKILEEEAIRESNLPENGEGNFMFDENVIEGKEVHLVSILKTAPLMLDLEIKNDMIVVRGVVKGGAASDNGFLRRGDVLLDVEGVDLIGLTAVEAQEAITEAMGRLSHHVDLIVACPPGRKPPQPQNIEDFLDEFSGHSHSESNTDSTDEQENLTGEQKSFVAKFIAQFESKSPKKNAFLLRRDSLEKARDSVRLYKERKRKPLIPKSQHSPSQVMTMKLNAADNHEGPDIHSLGVPSSVDIAASSPMDGKTSAFAMHDSKPVNIASAARQNWNAAVRKVSMDAKDMPGRPSGGESSSDSGPSTSVTPSKASVTLSLESDEIQRSTTHSISSSSMPSINSTPTSISLKDTVKKEAKPITEKSREKRGGSLPNVSNPSNIDDAPLSPNQHKVEALVHSPPRSVSSDEMLSTWAPTSPPRSFSASTENLASRKSVAFDRVVTEIDQVESFMSPKFKSKSVDMLNERVERYPKSNGNSKEQKSYQQRKKSVGFKDTVERIEPTSFRSMDDISMIGKSGWDERMAKYEKHRKDTKQSDNLPMPRKSALRNTPSPLQLAMTDEDGQYQLHHGMLSHDSGTLSPPAVTSLPDPKLSTSARDAQSKSLRLVPSNSLDDDPHFDEEIDRLGRSVDPSFVIPEPDYEDVSGYIPQPLPPPVLPIADQSPKHPKRHAPPPPLVKQKKKDGGMGLTNRLLTSAKDKLKRVGMKRSSQLSHHKESHDETDKSSHPSKVSSAPHKTSLAKPPMAPPPPPPPPPPPSQSAVEQPPSSNSTRSSISSKSPSPRSIDASLTQMIVNSPVRKAAAARDFDELEQHGFKHSSSDQGNEVDINSSMNAAMASEMTEDVKMASVVAGGSTGPRPKHLKMNRLVDMTDVLSELKVKSHQRAKRPVSVHSERPSTQTNSYSKDNIMGTKPSPVNQRMEVLNLERSSLDSTPSKSGPDPRESRISRRQARSVADIDNDSFDFPLTGIASNPVTPRSALSLNTPDSSDGALLEMEGTLKEFDEVIRSLDTEL